MVHLTMELTHEGPNEFNDESTTTLWEASLFCILFNSKNST